ncbi:hypothetical protein Q5P01_017216 [Channa striata]|uniref:Uncharacterized protein n=1 Tax=Channa striata TaxID=64152 RepID=A0AA88MBX3_CHASR|nr:hypothetical protein Q5P01_017216 [Channa striata]
MKSSMCLIIVIAMTLYISRTLGCLQRNASCENIKTPDGFKFPFNCPAGMEVSAFINDTVAAHADLHAKTYNFSSDVVSMNDSVIVMRQCRDLKIHCVLNNGPYVDESCENYNVKEVLNHPDLQKPRILKISVSVGVIVVFCITGILFGVIKKIWRKKTAQGETAETRSLYLCGCGENYVREHEQDSTLSTVHVERNTRHDPGGVNQNIGTNNVRDSAQGFDTAGEGIALVNEHSFDQGQHVP